MVLYHALKLMLIYTNTLAVFMWFSGWFGSLIPSLHVYGIFFHSKNAFLVLYFILSEFNINSLLSYPWQRVILRAHLMQCDIKHLISVAHMSKSPLLQSWGVLETCTFFQVGSPRHSLLVLPSAFSFVCIRCSAYVWKWASR